MCFRSSGQFSGLAPIADVVQQLVGGEQNRRLFGHRHRDGVAQRRALHPQDRTLGQSQGLPPPDEASRQKTCSRQQESG